MKLHLSPTFYSGSFTNFPPCELVICSFSSKCQKWLCLSNPPVFSILCHPQSQQSKDCASLHFHKSLFKKFLESTFGLFFLITTLSQRSDHASELFCLKSIIIRVLSHLFYKFMGGDTLNNMTSETLESELVWKLLFFRPYGSAFVIKLIFVDLILLILIVLLVLCHQIKVVPDYDKYIMDLRMAYVMRDYEEYYRKFREIGSMYSFSMLCIKIQTSTAYKKSLLLKVSLCCLEYKKK